MLSRFLSFCFVFSTLFFSQWGLAGYGHASAQCELVFTNQLSTYRQPTLEQLHIKSEATQSKSGWMAPTFVTPAQEMELYKTRRGITGPTFVQKSLVEGDRLIPSALIDAKEPGVVKTSDGIMIHVLGNIDGKSFVMGVSNYSLAANEARYEKHYDSEDSQDVILWVHGGGTGTTGHHTAANLMGYFRSYKVDVISIDMPWHANGMREDHVQAAKETLEFLEAVRKKYASKGKRVWLAGHSMGGATGLLYQQIYGHKTDVFAGIMALSPVVDVLPGGNIVQKSKEFERLDTLNRENTEMSEVDRALGEVLASQGKISPVCGLFCDLLIYSLDSNEAMKPEKKIPTMVLIGKGDGLYQGSEKHFEKLAQHPAKSVEMHIIGQRRSLKDKEGGAVANIGHMVFDHKPLISMKKDLSDAALQWLDHAPTQLEAAFKLAKDYRAKFAAGKITREELSRDFKKQIIAGRVTPEYLKILRDQDLISWDSRYSPEDLGEIETFVLMRKFMSKVSGEDLAKRIKTSGPDSSLHVRYNFINNLVFREFASSYIYTHERASELKASLGRQSTDIIRKALSSLREEVNGSRKISDADIMSYLHIFKDDVLELVSVKKFVQETQLADKASWIQDWDQWSSHLIQVVQNPVGKDLMQNLDLLRKMLDLKNWTDKNKLSVASPAVEQEFRHQLALIKQNMQKPQPVDRQVMMKFLLDSMMAHAAKIEKILNGLDIPQDANAPKVASLLNTAEVLKRELRDQRKKRSSLKAKIKQESERKKSLKKTLLSLSDWVRSDILKELYNQKQEAFEKQQVTDKLVREKLTNFLSSRFNGVEFAGGTFGALPADLIADFDRYEVEKREYLRLSSDYETALFSELEHGHAKLKSLHGFALGHLLNSIHRGIVTKLISSLDQEYGAGYSKSIGLKIIEYYNDEGLKSGEKIVAPESEESRKIIRSHLEHIIYQLGQDWGSNAVLVHALTDEARILDEHLADLQTKIFHIDNEIYQLRGQKYFTYEYYTFMSLLNMPEAWYAVPENRAEINNLFQKLWKEWQDMWGDRQADSEESLY